ncbi:hypothetical protein I203_106494 [Kwoniella mangroviensis CBS 8507]|uniref:uncharacterized protein n=1 Tax=Kwoniella mangroviensis CBS 8507 TaxID=1296122 RepID=UPI00080D1ACF|nr:uncharacterized protein I203_07010 [Kwoniella mangroviensis CBS 8507]OCF64053.1 hypothetical protein I203_07010 [Kwoniella mangroviensis CBS 8507]
MRASVITALLLSIATTSTIAAPSPVALKTDSVDKKVASYDTPKNFHQDCDKHNVQCNAMNKDVYGSANQGSGAVGKQIGHVANTGSQIAAIEGQNDLSKTLASDGRVIQHDLQGRDHGHSEMNEGIKKTSSEVYPEGLLVEGGKFMATQGEAAEVAGKGLNTVGKEANGEAKTASKGRKDHGDSVVNAVVS